LETLNELVTEEQKEAQASQQTAKSESKGNAIQLAIQYPGLEATIPRGAEAAGKSGKRKVVPVIIMVRTTNDF